MIFDRSWYNRAGVERVMGFCTEEEVKRFLAAVDSGVRLLKYWLEVSQEEQTNRLEARIHDGRKIWKLTPMDLESYTRWYDYSLFPSSRRDVRGDRHGVGAPWFIVRSDDKRRARLNVIDHLLRRIPYKNAPRERVKLPKRSDKGAYDDLAPLEMR